MSQSLGSGFGQKGSTLYSGMLVSSPPAAVASSIAGCSHPMAATQITAVATRHRACLNLTKDLLTIDRSRQFISARPYSPPMVCETRTSGNCSMTPAGERLVDAPLNCDPSPLRRIDRKISLRRQLSRLPPIDAQRLLRREELRAEPRRHPLPEPRHLLREDPVGTLERLAQVLFGRPQV